MGSRNNKPGRIVKGTALQPSLKSASGVWSLDEAMQAHRANAWPQPNLFQPVANSLRFSTAKTSYMTRTGTRGGASTTWTWSGWVKPTMYDNGAYNNVMFYAEDPAGTISMVSFEQSPNSPAYRIYVYHNSQNNETTQVFRDPSAWYHITAIADTTNSTSGDRLRLYINGSRVTSFAASASVTQGASGGAGRPNTTYWISKQGPTLARYGDSYLAEVNFVDGYALDPSLFGKFDTDNTWVPIPYTGSYGTNGFYLPFTNATTSQTLGYDASLNGTPTYDADQDPYRGSVALHLTGNGPAGGQNNSFVESSSNNHPITRSGSVTQGSFSPFPLPTNTPYNPAVHGASAYFGTSNTDNIYASPSQYNNSLAIGTNNFTIEFWINWSTWAAEQRYVLMGQAGSSNFEIGRTTAGGNNLLVYTNTSLKITASFTPTIGAWYHIAVVRSGTGSGQLALYINGVSIATGTSADSISANNFFVGGLNWAAGYNHIGYMSGLRVINGSAVYTAAFTPPNRPFGTLTNNIIPFSEDFTNSYWTVNAASITPGATIAPDGTPTGALFAWTTATAQHYIIRSSLTSEGNTVTASVYVKAKPNSAANWMIFGDLANNYMYINLLTGTIGTLSQITNAAVNSVGNGWFRISGTWTSGGASSGWGAYVASADNVSNPAGTDTTSGFYIWGAQLETGSTLGNYTPTPANFSTAPSLLLNFANAAVTDTAGGDNIVTGSTATITSASKYGSGAMTFNGTSDYVAARSTTSYTFGTANFTIEYWVYFNSVAATQCVAAAYDSNGADATSPAAWTIRSNGVLSWEGYFGSTSYVGTALTPTATVTANTWHHVATVRNNGEIIAFLNGRVVGRVSVGTAAVAAPGGGVHIGRAGLYNGQFFNGSVDDFRVTKSVARYTSDFAPPARALPEIGGKSFVTTNVNAGVVQRFTTVGTTSWTAPTDVTQVEVLVVGGGGSGGSNNAGGGGGGGVIYNNQYPVTPGQTYTVTVGAGGISQAGSGGTNSGYQGTLSQFGNLVATPGCGGYGGNGQRGQESGSGSGGGGCRGVGPGAGFPGQGFSGGANRVSPEGGGGGGAGGAGGTGPGNGGPGLQFGISGTPTYYAGGGGGGAEATPNSPVAGAGGLGGGGAGGAVSGATYAAGWSSGSGQAGTANTGGGGGGESAGNGGFVTGAGGSGVVIVRYTTQSVGNSSDATSDNLVDSPTQYGHDTGAGGEVVGNYATLNPLALPSGATLSNGNLTITGVTAYRTTPATIAMTSGKWYWENKLLTYTGSDIHVGVCLGNFTSFQGTWVLSTANGWGYTCQGGYGYHNNTLKNISSSARSTGDTIGIAFDADGGNLYAYVNGVVVNGGSPIYTGLTSGPYFPFVTTGDSNTNVAVNFGQRAWAYAPPAGFTALTTKNLPRLTNAAAIAPNQYFDTVLYTGTGSARSVSGFNFEPDLLWVKDRSTSAYHRLFDRVRGVTNSPGLYSNDTSSEGADNLTFTSTGFSYTTDPYSTGMNVNGNLHVVWGWKAGGTAVSNTSGTITSQVSANTTSGFSIVSYTGTGVQATVGHGLPTAPSFIILKSRTNATRNWATYHSSFVPGEFIYLNSDGAKASDNSSWGPVTSTTFQLGNGVTPNTSWNQSGNTFIAYCWAEVAGFSKFGTYTGNGSADGPFIYTGFKPRFVMVKSSTNTFRWIIWDTARDPINFATRGLSPNLAAAEVTAFDADILSNGFKLRDLEGTLNESSGTYIYMAFADKPFGNVNGTAR